MAPLVNKNAIIAEYKNANAKQIQAAYEYEQSIINAYAEVANQLSNIDNLDKNYQLKIRQVDALVQSIDVSANYLNLPVQTIWMCYYRKGMPWKPKKSLLKQNRSKLLPWWIFINRLVGVGNDRAHSHCYDG